jgi:hypothetical protein
VETRRKAAPGRRRCSSSRREHGQRGACADPGAPRAAPSPQRQQAPLHPRPRRRICERTRARRQPACLDWRARARHSAAAARLTGRGGRTEGRPLSPLRCLRGARRTMMMRGERRPRGEERRSARRGEQQARCVSAARRLARTRAAAMTSSPSCCSGIGCGARHRSAPRTRCRCPSPLPDPSGWMASRHLDARSGPCAAMGRQAGV